MRGVGTTAGPGLGGGVAAACLTMLSVWRWLDGQQGWAVVLLALAAAQLAVTARRTAAWRGSGGGLDADRARRHLPGWRAICVVAVVGALATAAVLPPLALVLAGLGVFAALRARAYGREVAAA